jgi:D-alanyl-D-alanine carboxypeptidase
MNEKAQAIGMEDTAFSGATSLDPATTTVRDLFVLASYIKQAKRFMLDVTLAEEKELKQEGEVFRWENRNPWVKRQDAEFRGGVVRADVRGGGSALVLFSLPLSEFGSRTLAFIVVDAPQVVSDVDVLRTFIQESFVYGQERTGGDFIRETGEPTIDLFYKVERLLEIDKSLKSHIPVEAV